MKVMIVDAGMGNIHSLISALNYLGVEPVVTDDPAAFESATHVILPGVGAFDAAMQSLGDRSLTGTLQRYAVDKKKPLLGVCLGMQLLFQGSEEGRLPGLALMPGRFLRLAPDLGLCRKVPHVGFASIYGYREVGLFRGLGPNSHFYFTHSYGLPSSNGDWNVASCAHTQPFVAAFQKDHLCGVQFHPEKSQSTGLRLISNFLELSSPSTACEG